MLAIVSDSKINKQDQNLFRQTIGDVVTVKSDKKQFIAHKKPSTKPRPQLLDYAECSGYEKLGLGDDLSFVVPRLQKNILKKIRQGFFEINAKIDLHGLSRAQARHKLSKFLHSFKQNDWQCVLIIHGKGCHSVDNQPVLKNSLNEWLRQHQEVLAFCSAKPADGGTGATYVLLGSY